MLKIVLSLLVLLHSQAYALSPCLQLLWSHVGQTTDSFLEWQVFPDYLENRKSATVLLEISPADPQTASLAGNTRLEDLGLMPASQIRVLVSFRLNPPGVTYVVLEGEASALRAAEGPIKHHLKHMNLRFQILGSTVSTKSFALEAPRHILAMPDLALVSQPLFDDELSNTEDGPIGLYNPDQLGLVALIPRSELLGITDPVLQNLGIVFLELDDEDSLLPRLKENWNLMNETILLGWKNYVVIPPASFLLLKQLNGQELPLTEGTTVAVEEALRKELDRCSQAICVAESKTPVPVLLPATDKALITYSRAVSTTQILGSHKADFERHLRTNANLIPKSSSENKTFEFIFAPQGQLLHDLHYTFRVRQRGDRTTYMVDRVSKVKLSHGKKIWERIASLYGFTPIKVNNIHIDASVRAKIHIKHGLNAQQVTSILSEVKNIQVGTDRRLEINLNHKNRNYIVVLQIENRVISLTTLYDQW